MWLTQTGVKTETEMGTERFCKRLTHKSEAVSQVGAKTESEIGMRGAVRD